MDARPSDIIDAISAGMRLEGSVATDTETSGLFADDGARTSTASVAWIDDLNGWDEWANRFDNVTYGLEEISPGYDVYIVSVAWPFDQGVEGKPEDNGQGTLWPDAENLNVDQWRALLQFLSSYDLTMHHAKFDCEKYRVGVRRWPGVGQELMHLVRWDTQNVVDMIYPEVTDPKKGNARTTSLKPTSAFKFGKEWADEAEVVKKYLQKAKLPAGRWDLIPWEVIAKYADTDARLTLMLMLRQQYDIDNKNAGTWFGSPDDVYRMAERRLATSTVLYRMERRGVPYDEVASREAAIECRNRAKVIEAELPFRPTGDAAKEFFFTEKGLDLVPYAVSDKTGEPSLTGEIVQRMINDRVPHADKWGEWTKVSNAASMWYEGYADRIGPDGRLRCAFRQNGTRSTRFSVERLNLQAIPQDYRLSDHSILDGIITPRQIIANAVPQGWRLFELDLAQAELRVATMFAKCLLMERMIREGEDLHTYTTKALFPDVDPEDPLFHAKWRQVGKRGNFSLCFGAKGATFRAMVSKETGIILSETEADRIVRDWNALYPEFGAAIDKHQNKVAKRQYQHGLGWIEFINGERRWFQEFEETHKAFNQRVQGNLAQFGIDWMLQTEEFLYRNHELQQRAFDEKIGEPGLVMTIHDSQMLLLPDDKFGQNLAHRCANFGKALWAETFPGIPGDVDYHGWERTA